MHTPHLVTVKAAIYSEDYTHVLMMHLFSDGQHFGYGLPGGHIEKDEMPDAAMTRELQEELGATIDTLQHRDFFVHQNGKIVLGFVGVASLDLAMAPSQPDVEVGIWKTRQAFEALDIDTGYKRFVLENWPV